MSETPYMRLAVDMTEFPEGVSTTITSNDNTIAKAVYYSRGSGKEYYKVSALAEGIATLTLRVADAETDEVLHSETITFQVNA